MYKNNFIYRSFRVRIICKQLFPSPNAISKCSPIPYVSFYMTMFDVWSITNKERLLTQAKYVYHTKIPLFLWL